MTAITPNTFISRTKTSDFSNPIINFTDYTQIVTKEKSKEFSSAQALMNFFLDNPHYRATRDTTCEDTQFRGKVYTAFYEYDAPTFIEMSEKAAYAKAKENLKALTKAYKSFFQIK